ncbi:MAG: hypothetical protein KBC72_00565 [Acinetobacter sp.]|nr:hypothetical protein [Acinetobacter sp.]
MGNFTYNLPFNLVNGTTADALEVMANYNAGRNSHNAAFNGTTGHGHTGATGDGPILSGASISITAADVPIVDAGGYYPGTNVETALQNIGSGAATGLNFTTPTITNPTITGTVAGSATYTTPTLNTPVIANFTSAQHDHLDADDGGTLDAAAIASGTLNIARIPVSSIDHNALLNLAVGDPHPQYADTSGSQTITGDWQFDGEVQYTDDTATLSGPTTARLSVRNAISSRVYFYDTGGGTYVIQGDFNISAVADIPGGFGISGFQIDFDTDVNNIAYSVVTTGVNNMTSLPDLGEDLQLPDPVSSALDNTTSVFYLLRGVVSGAAGNISGASLITVGGLE